MEQRLNRLRVQLDERGLESLLVLSPENRRYLSGFTGSTGWLLVTKHDAVFLTDGRYTKQASEECPHLRIAECRPLLDGLRAEVQQLGLRELGFEDEIVTIALHRQLADALDGVTLTPTHDLIETLREIKDASELTILREAAQIADAAFSHILHFLRPGLKETDVSLELEVFMRKLGAQGRAFDIIVASGHRSALPHGRASDKILEAGDFVKMDFGAYYKGYSSDITRTVVLGQPSDKQREIYNIVREAQEHAVRHIKPGLTGREADALARDIIVARGYDFSHTLGHGLGLAVHERPSLAARNEQVLQPGMVVTVEPGIYLPDWGGVRIEDDIVLIATGNDVLTHSTKELVIIE